MAQRENPLVAEFRKDYERFFRDGLNVELGVWRRYHEGGFPDKLGSFTPSQVIAQTHRVAWEMALEQSAMHAKYAVRDRQGLPDPDFQQFELSLYWDAIESIAPAEWRAEFLGKPPPKERLGGIYGD